MPKPRVYIETTIPSFYHDPRVDPNASLGLYVPRLATPRDLLGRKDE
jgi:hypothetical protein